MVTLKFYSKVGFIIDSPLLTNTFPFAITVSISNVSLSTITKSASLPDSILPLLSNFKTSATFDVITCIAFSIGTLYSFILSLTSL